VDRIVRISAFQQCNPQAGVVYWVKSTLFFMEIRRRSPAPAVVVESQVYQVNMPGCQPRNILEEIVWHKEAEVEKLRQQLPLEHLQQQIRQQQPPLDFAAALGRSESAVALIAEVKRASPSRGVLRQDFNAIDLAQTYAAAGASCLSVLTDSKFFQGSGDYLRQIRETVALPLLCKEFILYPYQILWARSLGADAVLLIAALLNNDTLNYFLKLIHKLGMTALVEVHTLTELDRVLELPLVQVIGINNRDLTTFQVNLETTQELLRVRGSLLRNRGITIVSESGIHNPTDLQRLQRWGVQAVLVGEALVTAPDPGAATRSLLSLSL
jgi:indole-3-glycerol phosphate synthase